MRGCAAELMCSCAHCCVPQAKEMHEKLAASMRSRIHALELEIGELNESATPNREKIDELTREKDELTRNLRMTEANLSIITNESESARMPCPAQGRRSRAVQPSRLPQRPLTSFSVRAPHVAPRVVARGCPTSIEHGWRSSSRVMVAPVGSEPEGTAAPRYSSVM